MRRVLALLLFFSLCFANAPVSVVAAEAKTVSTTTAQSTAYFQKVADAAAQLRQQIDAGENEITIFYKASKGANVSTLANNIYETAVIGIEDKIESYGCSATYTTSSSGMSITFNYSIDQYESVDDTGLDYFVSEAKAAKYLRKKMVSRKGNITVYLLTDDSDNAEEIGSRLLKKAFNYTGEATEGDYLKQAVKKTKKTCSATKYKEGYLVKLTLKMTYRDTKSQETEVTKKTNSILNALEVAGKSDFVKAKAIYDYIRKTVSYDAEHKGSAAYALRHTSYAALINGTASCMGYASAYYRLAVEAGLECRTVRSYGDAWNMVKIDGRWYFIDSCRDAKNDTKKYFLKGTTSFYKTHDKAESTYKKTVSAGDYMRVSLSDKTTVSKKPRITVKNGSGKKLKKGKNYSISYAYNSKTREVAVTVKGKGNYKGTTVKKVLILNQKT